MNSYRNGIQLNLNSLLNSLKQRQLKLHFHFEESPLSQKSQNIMYIEADDFYTENIYSN